MGIEPEHVLHEPGQGVMSAAEVDRARCKHDRKPCVGTIMTVAQAEHDLGNAG
jgi:hypothetical protein